MIDRRTPEEAEEWDWVIMAVKDDGTHLSKILYDMPFKRCYILATMESTNKYNEGTGFFCGLKYVIYGEPVESWDDLETFADYPYWAKPSSVSPNDSFYTGGGL